MEIVTDPAAKIVGKLMSTRVVTVAMDDTLDMIQRIFRRIKFHHVLVMEEGELVGIISDRDLLKAVSPFVGTLSETTRDIATLSKRAHQIMSHRPITIRPTATIQDASLLMLRCGVSCLPVLSEEGTVLGIISWKDLLKGVLNLTP